MMQYLETRIPSTFVGYMNGDLLFHSVSLLSSLDFIASSFLPDHPNVMIMGRRYNRDMSLKDDWSGFSSSDFDRIIETEIAFSDLFISVAQDYWGLGIGRALTEACIESAKAAGYIQLELAVVSENLRAITLYKKLGFVEYGRNPKGFRSRLSGFQEIIYMRLEL